MTYYVDLLGFHQTNIDIQNKLYKKVLEFISDNEKVVNGFANGGLYRNVDISIRGSNHTPPSFIKVYDRMKRKGILLENIFGE